MSTTYVPIRLADFRSFMESDTMKFAEITLEGVREHVWERKLPLRDGWAGTYAVRVYSTVEFGVTRPVGDDAIRVLLWDIDADRPLSYEKRVHRTKNALTHLEDRARAVWAYAASSKNRCPKCGRLMHVVEPRKTFRNKTVEAFFSCTGYHSRTCTYTSRVPEWLKE